MRSLRGRGLLAAACLSVTMLAAGCSSQGAARTEGDISYVAGDGSTVIVARADRKPAPALAAPTLLDGAFDGPVFDLAAQRGKVVVLNVWASWCVPCRAEASALARISGKLASDGVVFAGLNTRDTAVAAQGFVDRFGIPYPSLDDTFGLLQLGFRDSLALGSIPSTVVIDKQGRVAARALGEIDESRVRGLVEPLLREQG